MWPNPQETEDFVTFTEEILSGTPYFFVQCSLIKEKEMVSVKTWIKLLKGTADIAINFFFV